MARQATPLSQKDHREQARSYSGGGHIVRVLSGRSYHELFNFP